MRRVVLFALLLLAAITVQAQTKLIFEETTPEAYLMKQGSGNQAYLNEIINLLSQADVSKRGARPARKPEFVVRMEQQARIADAGDKLQLRVQLAKINVNTDVTYKGFDVGDILFPDRVHAKVKLLDAAKKELKVYNVTDVAFKKEGVTLLDTSIPDTAKIPQKYSLVVDAKELIYTAGSVAKARRHFDLIRDYYAAEATIVQALQDVNRIRPDDVDRISLQERNLRQMEDMYARIQNEDFKTKLNLRQYDPVQLSTKMADLKRQLQERRRAVDYALSTMDLQFFNKGMSLATAGNATAAQSYFVKSLEVNPAFAPSHLQLARLDFVNGYIHEATTRTLALLTRLRIDPETRGQALVLAHDIYATHLSRGNNLTNRGDYETALQAFSTARELCHNVAGLQCNMPVLRDGEGRAAAGMFQRVVEEGKRELSRNNLAKADELAGEALNLQRQYNHWLRSAPEATDLQNQVKYTYYLQYIDKGKSYLSAKNYKAALDQFDNALDLQEAYTFRGVNELPDLAQRAAKPVLLGELKQGYEQAMANRLADARTVASNAMAMQSRYGLNQDAEVLRNYNLLRDRIFTQECQNAQTAYDTQIQKAQELARNKQFLVADKAYAEAQKIADQNNVCQIADFTARDGREAILPGVRYQQMMEDVNRFVASNRYTEAIQTYNQAEKLYLAEKVNRFGLTHVSLYNYARQTTKLPFAAEVVQHFTTLGEEEIAINLLTIILDKNYKNRKTKKVQQQIGRQLAHQDAQLGLQEDIKVLSAKYSNNNRDLKKLKKAYEKGRKKIAKTKK